MLPTSNTSALRSHSPRTPPLEVSALQLDPDERISECTAAAARLFGYQAENELVGHPIADLLPQLSLTPLIQGGRVSGRIKMLCRCGIAFIGRRRDGSTFEAQLYFNEFEQNIQHRIVLIVRDATDIR